MSVAERREKLKDLDPDVRRTALNALASDWRTGELSCTPETDAVNMHCHTFFSYNGYGHSPSSLAWLAREQGWRALGTVDFDVLDAVDETLAACDLVGVRGASGLETRVYHAERPDWAYNSPGEPGILYYVGIGFAAKSAPRSAATVLADMRRRAGARNEEMVARLNAYLDPVVVDYRHDVLPLTPSGNATERHMLVAYDNASRRHNTDRKELLGFWARKLDMRVTDVDAFLGDKPFPHDPIRAKLMKRGGVGYAQPGSDTFPTLDTVHEAIVACGALPTYAFLDGLSEGEGHLDELFESLIARGMAGLTVIPDRNWNVADSDERSRKETKLGEAIGLARSLDLPLIIGTEMNKPGQREIDDLSTAALQPYHDDIVRGADFCYGHTVLQRALGAGYQSEWARQYLAERRERVQFFTEVGRVVAPSATTLARISQLNMPMGADKLMSRLEAL